MLTRRLASTAVQPRRIVESDRTDFSGNQLIVAGRSQSSSMERAAAHGGCWKL
jgi:hypothetical protein